MHIPFNAAIPFWDFYLKEMLVQVYKNTCRRVFPSGWTKKYENYITFINRGMLLKDRVHSYNGILCGSDMGRCLKRIQWGKGGLEKRIIPCVKETRLCMLQCIFIHRKGWKVTHYMSISEGRDIFPLFPLLIYISYIIWILNTNTFVLC